MLTKGDANLETDFAKSVLNETFAEMGSVAERIDVLARILQQVGDEFASRALQAGIKIKTAVQVKGYELTFFDDPNILVSISKGGFLQNIFSGPPDFKVQRSPAGQDKYVAFYYTLETLHSLARHSSDDISTEGVIRNLTRFFAEVVFTPEEIKQISAVDPEFENFLPKKISAFDLLKPGVS